MKVNNKVVNATKEIMKSFGVGLSAITFLLGFVVLIVYLWGVVKFVLPCIALFLLCYLVGTEIMHPMKRTNWTGPK